MLIQSGALKPFTIPSPIITVPVRNLYKIAHMRIILNRIRITLDISALRIQFHYKNSRSTPNDHPQSVRIRIIIDLAVGQPGILIAGMPEYIFQIITIPPVIIRISAAVRLKKKSRLTCITTAEAIRITTSGSVNPFFTVKKNRTLRSAGALPILIIVATNKPRI